MKRSESVLVYGVTGLLLVILGVAVLFGNEAGAGADPTDETKVTTADDLFERLQDGEASDPDLDDGASDDDATAGEEAGAPGTDDEAASPEDDAVTPNPVALRTRTVLTVLGDHRVVDYGGQRFRQVEVQNGDTFSGLVQKWCGDLAMSDVAQALNEEVDAARLRTGQTLLLPFVADDELLAAYDRRMAAPTRVDPPETRAPTPKPTAPAVAAGGEEYTVQSGESLWTIAARKVGRNKAQSYVDRIVAANPNISDPSRVRADMKIRLP